MAINTLLLSKFKKESKNWIKDITGKAQPAWAVLVLDDTTYEASPITFYRESDTSPIYVQFRGIWTNYDTESHDIDYIYITGNQSDWQPITAEEVEEFYDGADSEAVRLGKTFVTIELTSTDIKTIAADQPYAILIKFQYASGT